MIGDNKQQNRPHNLIATLLTICDEATFQRCLVQLDAYIAAQLDGQDYRALYPETAVLLDACPDCAAAYARLYELETAVRASQLPQPAQIPPPNLSFLPQPSLLAQLQQAWQQSADTLTLQLTQGLVTLLTPAPAPHTRAVADSSRYRELLLRLSSQEAAQLALPLTIAAYRDSENEPLCLVQVRLLPGTEQADLFDKMVILGWKHGQQTAVTDWGGLAEFADVPIATLPYLQITVKL